MVSYLDEVENMRMIFSTKFVIPKFLCLIYIFFHLYCHVSILIYFIGVVTNIIEIMFELEDGFKCCRISF